jgi:SAM domain (Sterile alpha motif)
MRQIGEWLEKLGMSEYAQRFAENGITVAALPHLTEQDLKEIGVLLGHRRIMLAAIGESSSKPTAPAPAPTTGTPILPPPTPATEATARLTMPTAEAAGERRYLTVMFCDLVGSTTISAQLDAEEWRDLVGAYLDAASAAVTGDGRPCRQEAGRRAYVPVRLSAGA